MTVAIIQPIVVKADKSKLQRIKRKYNENMSDETAKKIRGLEILNNVLSASTVFVGIATVVDYIVPDPIPGIDEALLTGVTALLGTASGIVNNNIKNLANEANPELTMDDVRELNEGLVNIINSRGKNKQGNRHL